MNRFLFFIFKENVSFTRQLHKWDYDISSKIVMSVQVKCSHFYSTKYFSASSCYEGFLCVHISASACILHGAPVKIEPCDHSEFLLTCCVALK